MRRSFPLERSRNRGVRISYMLSNEPCIPSPSMGQVHSGGSLLRYVHGPLYVYSEAFTSYYQTSTHRSEIIHSNNVLKYCQAIFLKFFSNALSQLRYVITSNYFKTQSCMQ